MTQKERVEKLPSTRGTKMDKEVKKKKKRTPGSPGGSPARTEDIASEESGSGKKRQLSPARLVVQNVTYR